MSTTIAGAMPGAPSSAAQRMTYRVLVTDEIDPEGVALLTAESALTVDEVPTLPKQELLERIGDYDAIVGRSATRISVDLLERATRLKVVGRAGVGVDNIAIEKATELGIAIINAPAGNTVAVAELFFGTVIGLLRFIPRADATMREGKWDRSKFLGSELHGKTLGIVGVGRIGSEVARRARVFGMDVVGYDPYIPEERFRSLQIRCTQSLDQLLADVDFLTVHTPLNEETKGMIGRAQMARLRPGAVVVNMARGGIVDEPALLAALASGQVGGAVLDVYPSEPLAKDSPLRSLPNVVLTPHVGASTAEAQRNVAVDACAAVRDALLRGELSRSINLAAGADRSWGDLQPTILVVQRAAAVARAILADQGLRALRRITLRCGPRTIGSSGVLLSAAAVGVLEGTMESERLNLINARALAESRGLELATAESEHLGHPEAIEVSLGGGMQELAVEGLATNDVPPRLTRIGAFLVDVPVRQTLIVLTNHDVPGVIGRVGTLLGNNQVNIAEYHQARVAQGGEALAAISVDGTVDEEVRKRLLELPDVLSATIVNFRG